MLSPYLEWEEITPFHAYMSVFRAIENGFSMIRPAGDGLSLAVDYQGRVLAAKNEARTNQRIMFADLPLKGVRTVYAFIGDSFAWLCILGFLALGTAAGIRGIIRRAACYAGVPPGGASEIVRAALLTRVKAAP